MVENMSHKTRYEAVFDILNSFPEGLAQFEVAAFVEDTTEKRSIAAQLSQLVKEGLAAKAGFRVNPETSQNCQVYAVTGKSFAARDMEPRAPTRKRRGPSEGELKELRAWKAAAIVRFPELGIDPLILEARRRVAKIYLGEGMREKAVMVERGDMDAGETIRIVRALIASRAA